MKSNNAIQDVIAESQELAQRNYNNAMIAMDKDAIITSHLNGADIQSPVTVGWDPFYDAPMPRGTVWACAPLAYVSPLIMALDYNKPIVVQTLFSCGYKITDFDKQELKSNTMFYHSVSECIKVVEPKYKDHLKFMMAYLTHVMVCDTPILEAVYNSLVMENAREISRNKQVLEALSIEIDF